MKISAKGRYGLRVMMELAENYGRGPMPVEVIAKKQAISGNYIHVLVMGLKAAGLVRSVRGPGGGYKLSKSPSSITALDVVSALEGRSIPVECVADSKACPRAEQCASRDLWCDMAAAIDGVLSEHSLEHLISRQHNKTEAAPTYCI